MNKKFLIILGALLGGFALVIGIRAVSKPFSQPKIARPQPALADTELTVADRQIRTAQRTIKWSPADPKGYNLLCAAYKKKARETGDFGFNARAEAALDQSFKLSDADSNYDAISLKASLLLTYHRFSEALEVARRAQKLRPQDPEIYGSLTDAFVELGDYEAALEAAQTMNNLRQDTTSYARASYLRELHGDTVGAIEAMRLAADSARDPESIAWCRVQLGTALINTGKLAAAEREYDTALYFFPGYPSALAAKASARLAAGDTAAAIEFYKQSLERIPLPETAVALGDLYTKLGRTDEAKKQYELVEFIERVSAASGTYSRQLALFYADHDMKLDDALQIAQQERAARSDIFTCDALGWVLYKKGDLAGAKAASDEALRLGTRDARIHYHAGMIARALGHKREATINLQLALKLNPFFDILQSDVARQTLRAITA